MCKKCICFLRVSTKHQDLKGQREQVISTAMADGYKADEIAVVEGKESAIKLNEEERQTLNEMKELVENHPTIESVYVFAIDRLARKISVIFSVKDYLNKQGINLVFLNPHKMATLKKVNGKLVEDEMTLLLLSMLAAGAEMEMKTKQARMQTAKQILLENNKVAYSKPMYGYKKTVTKSVMVDEQEANTVRYIYNEYVTANKSMMVIYNELVSKGIFKPAKVNTANSRIRNILANKAYTGDYSDNDTKQAIKYPRIITDELFEAAQVKLQHNREAYKTTSKNVYYGKSLCRCNGYLMVAYRNNAVYRDIVTKRGISINAVDTIIWNETCEIYADEQHITDESNKEEWLRQIDENEIKLGNINEILTKNKKQEERLIDLYVDGRINDEQFNSRVGDIKKDNEKWQNEVAKIYSQNQKLEMLLNDEINRVAPSKINSVESDLERKEIINQVIKEVLIEQKENGIWTIRVIAKNDILQNSREQSGEYYYYYNKGNKKHLVFVDSNENETDVEIVTRFKQL